MALEKIIHDSLALFVHSYIPDADLSVMDEVILSYITGVLEELGSPDSSEENFDVEMFVEMMEAYIPGFAEISSVAIYEMMFDLAAQLTEARNKENVPPPAGSQDTISSLNKQSSDREQKSSMELESSLVAGVGATAKIFGFCHILLHLLDWYVELVGFLMRKDWAGKARGDFIETYILTGLDVERKFLFWENLEESCDGKEDGVQLLVEMFPSCSVSTVQHVLSVAKGNLDYAVQLIMEGTVEQPDPATLEEKQPKTDKKIKASILEKYMMVDDEEDVKIHKPIAPKEAPKKLIRYIDNQVVSTKGERYTEVKKTESDEMKKTYINLKPARKYRFH